MMLPKILLLQAPRAGDPMAIHEHACFVDRCGLSADQLVPDDLCDGPPSLEAVRSHQALRVGGSGEFDVSKANLLRFEGDLDPLRRSVELLLERAAWRGAGLAGACGVVQQARAVPRATKLTTLGSFQRPPGRSGKERGEALDRCHRIDCAPPQASC